MSAEPRTPDPAWPLSKWSSRQKDAEIERLRRRVEADPTAKTVEAERAHAREREAELLDEIEALKDEPLSGVAGRTVGGKSALSSFRKETWAEFADAVTRLPTVRLRKGLAQVRLVVASELIPDLYLLGLVPPRGAVEARERDRLRRMLDSPPFVALMARDETWADRLRALFLSQVARAYLRPSIWTVYDRAVDDSRGDRYGSVVK